MSDLLIAILMGWVAWKVFCFVSEIMTMKEVAHDIRHHLANIIHNVEIEKVSGVEYWYDKDEGVFLGQGKTHEELVEHLKNRFPDHIFIVPDKGFLAAPDWKITDKHNIEKWAETIK